ncbi:hypothetical protein K505DRAFT_359073 [Melanomma pulvis-pyrius CBS 109.77]|uniref:Clr5 domain-containing protein n=1 Tax=Melanomma pulvis-pyrius CBS 109.77 TaxID=1314802 RepID=A0A6A6XLD5_9PLEO|nr:hypothetical protein K505DRAFT_359073 [Melanomma pulvis-pyrius CBS 109.77]
MPVGRRAINIQPHKEELVGLFHEGLTYEQLRTWLANTHHVTASLRTIKTWFKRWKVTRRLPTGIEDRIKRRIQVLFFEVGLEDHEILEVLRGEGHTIGKYTVTRLRLELGLQKRTYGRAAKK